MLLLSLLLLGSIVPTSFASSNPSYSTVCSPQACTELPKGQSFSLSLGASSLPTSDTDSASILILPGTYSSSSLPPLLGTRNASYAPLSHLTPFTNYSLSAQANPFTIAPAEAGAMFYEGRYWQGEDSLVASGRGEGVRAESVVLGTESDSWVKLKVDGVERVLWSSVADFGGAPFLVDGTKHSLEVFVVDVQSSACSTPCSHGGSCVASGSSTNGTCVCRPGFAGQICEQCAPGHYGPSCIPCSESCSSGQCADGSSGTGACLILPSPNATTSCNCLHGVCPPSSSSSSSTATCSCSPGFTSPNLTSSNPTFSSIYQQCSLCSEGYVAVSSTECRACPVGSTSCTSEGTPTACVEGYTLELGACVASDGPSGKGSSCAGSNYWSLTSKACTPCSPLCSSCYGSGSTHCLSCPSGQALLKGVCVDVDQSNGVCDSTTVGIGLGRSANAAWYFDSSKGECDACPSTSTGCEVPNFNSSSSLRSDVVSTGCIAGYFLSLEGKCVTSCPIGSLVTESSNSTCTACDSTCGSCETSPSHCLTCSDSSLVAYAGSCVSSTCPDSSVAINGTCVTCHLDCETCSGTAFNQCSTCPPGRPIRKDGRCLPVCAKNEWFDPATRSCSSCDSSCGSCLSSSPSSCTSCSQTDYTPLSGLCVPSNCSTTYVPYLQTCLSTLISQNTTSNASSSLSKLKLALIILIVLIFLLALLTFFIYRQRQKTRLATRRFADGLDDVDVAKRTAGLGGVLGAMARAREGMEDRWRNRSRSSGPGGKKNAGAGVYRLGTVKGKKGGGGRGEMKPLHLGTGWQDVQVDEFDEVLSRKGTLKKSVRSMMMAGDGEEGGRRTRSGRWSPPPYSRASPLDRDQEEYRDESPPPSPAYTSRSQYTARSHSRTHSHSSSIDDCSSSHRASNDDLRDQTFLSSGSSALGAQIIYPTILAPPLSHAHPQLFKTYSFSASAAAPPAFSSSSWVDTEVQPFPDFQSSYLATRTVPAGDHSSSRGGFSTNASSISDEHSFHHPSSRFLEDSDDDDDEEEDSRTPNPFSSSSSHGSSSSRHIIPPRSRSPSPSPPTSPTTPILPRASTYWTPSPSAEGGRHEVVIGFGRGSGLSPQRDRPGSGLSGRGGVFGSSSNNHPWFA